ncbi:hypothetical protein J1614_010966 [Plenodomus biglobosus]|nr:hypothetical protein J1614_010966 [Plenodomus biglobosus]
MCSSMSSDNVESETSDGEEVEIRSKRYITSIKCIGSNDIFSNDLWHFTNPLLNRHIALPDAFVAAWKIYPEANPAFYALVRWLCGKSGQPGSILGVLWGSYSHVMPAHVVKRSDGDFGGVAMGLEIGCAG